jgi:hypothetical protein
VIVKPSILLQQSDQFIEGTKYKFSWGVKMGRTSEYLHDLSAAHGRINVMVIRAILM